MENLTLNLINPMRRIHSLNRQKEYATPTKRDVLCPFFDGTFIKTGHAHVTSDYYAQCHDTTNEVACAYKEKLTEDVFFCKRYWKEDPMNMKLVRTEPVTPPVIWQQLNVQIDYERPFINRFATVDIALIQETSSPVDLGNFLRDWRQWYETNPGNWLQQLGAGGRQEILNTINQSGRSFWYNPAHISAKNYTHEYFVQARGSDDDMYGSVFRYSPYSSSFYTFEWDSGGLGINGMAIYRNRYVDGEHIKTRLAYSPIQWEDNKSHIHHVSISVIRNRVKAVIRRLNGSIYTHLATLEFIDSSVFAPTAGAWGPMTNSQPDTYFWGLNHKNSDIIDNSLDPRLSPKIPLSYEGISGGLHIVSQPMNEIFPESLILEVCDNHGIKPASITSVEYWLKHTNVYEGVQFSEYTSFNHMSTSPTSRISMSSFNYNEFVAPFKQTNNIYDRNIPHQIKDWIFIDKAVEKIIIKVSEPRIFDTIHILINDKAIKYVPNVIQTEYEYVFEVWIPVDIGDTVTVRYIPNPFEMEFYTGPHIDTHDKIFKFEGNVLGWHHVPLYEEEAK